MIELQKTALPHDGTAKKKKNSILKLPTKE
jgi:hypothetical protein